MKTGIPMIAIAVIGIGSLLVAEVTDDKVPGAIDQQDYPDSINACGPAAVLNLLRFSGQAHAEVFESLVGRDDGVKMRFFVDRYLRSRDSTVYPSAKRWGVHGVAAEDLLAGLNDLLEEGGREKLKGNYLDRRNDETEEAHLARVQRLLRASLDNGVTPILSLRSYLVREREEEAGWETGVHHNVVVTRVPEGASSVGFEIEAIDPYGGRSVEIFIHREGNGQSFLALKGTLDEGNWLRGRPFLQVVAPDVPTVRPRDLEWSQRYIVVANYLIGEF